MLRQQQPEMPWLRIEFNSSVDVGSDIENCLVRINGNILEAQKEDHIPAGRLTAFYADLENGAEQGFSAFDLLDLDAATAPFLELLAPSGEFSHHVERIVGETLGMNLLILDRVELLPAYRGRDLGLACLFRCMQTYGHGAALIALKCFPLQFEVHDSTAPAEWDSAMNLSTFIGSQGICASKLANHYKRLGFRRFRRTPLMVLNPSFRQPNLTDLAFTN